jgi:hypothetical protein
MGRKEIEPNEQQKSEPDQPKVILKPLLKGIHESPLIRFGVVGLIAEGNLPDLSRRPIHRTGYPSTGPPVGIDSGVEGRFQAQSRGVKRGPVLKARPLLLSIEDELQTSGTGLRLSIT